MGRVNFSDLHAAFLPLALAADPDRACRGAAQEAGALPMHLANIGYLGVKEFRSLLRDPIMLVLIVYASTVPVYTAATATPETLNKAPIAVVERGSFAAVLAHHQRLLTALFHAPGHHQSG
ncbi:hypothetical protein [Halomonas sp. KRD171]|uniref:hypothetical protein n=2 Tax=Gammaproteobacteria TaxID=1236 RepID=UPI001F49B4B6|nr:hypothetical protein [Halomonas sp. KRD171]